MKKAILILLFVIISIVPVYFLFIWNPQDSVSNAYKDDKSIEVSSNIDNSSGINKEYKDTDEESKITMLSKISEGDRNNIDKIINKLSIIDIVKINNYMTKEDINKGINDILQLTKKRLKQNEFEKIEKIINKYEKGAGF